MMRNRVTLIGRLGQDPEVKQFENGRTMARFSMATNESYTTASGERKEETHWHRIVAWGPLAEGIASHCHKGDEVMCEGKLTSRKYDTPDGETRYTVEVYLSSFLLVNRSTREEKAA